MALTLGFRGQIYDDAVPLYLVDHTGKWVRNRNNLHPDWGDVQSLLDQMAAEGHTPGPNEVGLPPSWWSYQNQPQSWWHDPIWSEQPDVGIDFSNPGSTRLDYLNFARTGEATYVDSSGTVRIAADGEMRVGHHIWDGTRWVNHGLLLESEARTNLVLHSEDLNDPVYAAPAFDVVPTILNNGLGGTEASNDLRNLRLYDQTNGAWVVAPLSYAGVTGRPSLTATIPAGCSALRGYALRDDAGGVFLYQTITVTPGDVVTLSVFADENGVGGIQLEVGATPSSYIPTADAQVTRAAETLTLTDAAKAEVLDQGEEQVTNGGFDTDTDWTKGDGWFIAGGKASCDGTQGAFSNLEQDFGTEAGKTYSVTYDVVETNGFPLTPVLGGATGTVATTVGTYTEILETTNTATLRFTANVDFIGSVDNVSVKELSMPTYLGPELVANGGFDTDLTGWTIGDGWSWEDGAAVCDGTQVATSTLSVGTPDLVSGRSYLLEIDLVSVDAGNIAVNIVGTGANDIVASTPGTYQATVTMAADGTTLNIDASIDFIGKVDNVSVREVVQAVSIGMDGTMTYADDGSNITVQPVYWGADSSNNISLRVSALTTRIGQFSARQLAAGVSDVAQSAQDAYSPGVNVPLNIASAHASNRVNGAYEGTVLTEDATPTALADLTAADFEVGPIFNGTIKTLRLWGVDITDERLKVETGGTLTEDDS